MTFNNLKQISLALVVGLVLSSCTIEKEHPLKSIGGILPKDSALIFGKGIVSTSDFEFSITFNPEMNELFFTRRAKNANNIIYHSKLNKDTWTKPEVAFFTANKGWDFEPHIHPNGNQLFFGSTRPLPDSTKSTGLYQWKSEKTIQGWTTPKPLKGAFLERNISMYLTSSLKDNYFFTSGEKGEKPEDWVIYNSTLKDVSFRKINRMPIAINGKGKWIAHSYIAPDESYMIYDFKDVDGYGNADLYISFNVNGKWTKPHNLGPTINTKDTEMCASVSPDGKYLFFHRGDSATGNIYWIEFESIRQELKKRITFN